MNVSCTQGIGESLEPPWKSSPEVGREKAIFQFRTVILAT